MTEEQLKTVAMLALTACEQNVSLSMELRLLTELVVAQMPLSDRPVALLSALDQSQAHALRYKKISEALRVELGLT